MWLTSMPAIRLAEPFLCDLRLNPGACKEFSASHFICSCHVAFLHTANALTKRVRGEECHLSERSIFRSGAWPMASEHLHPEVMVVPSHSACLKTADDAHVRARFWLQRICLIGRQLLTPLPCDVRHSHQGVCTRMLIWKKTGQQCPPAHADSVSNACARELENRGLSTPD